MLTAPSSLQPQLADAARRHVRRPGHVRRARRQHCPAPDQRRSRRGGPGRHGAPDFALPDQAGRQVRLSELLAHGPVVLTFFRGEWCPFCDLTLRAFETIVPDLAARGASLVAISPQTLDHSASTAESKGLSFPVLSDPGNAVAGRYGLVYSLTPAVRQRYAERGLDLTAFNGLDAVELPMPATFVIAQNGVIRWAFVDPDFTRRPEPSAILAALDELA